MQIRAARPQAYAQREAKAQPAAADANNWGSAHMRPPLGFAVAAGPMQYADQIARLLWLLLTGAWRAPLRVEKVTMVKGYCNIRHAMRALSYLQQ
jgi:hypothetical protein